jgi:hypothetical protein
MRPGSRKLLWMAACLVGMPLFGWGLGTGRLWAVGLGGVIAFVCLYFSLRKLACPKCGYVMRVVSVPANNCMKCGAPYEPANQISN